MLKLRRSIVTPPPPDCALSVCVRFLQGEWTANVLWYLRVSPRRFAELQRDLGRISAKMLAHRLKRLERDGLVARARKPTSPPSIEYSLTPLGMEMRPILESLVAFGERIKRRDAAISAARR